MTTVPNRVFTNPEERAHSKTGGLDGRKTGWANTPEASSLSSTNSLSMKPRHNVYAQPTTKSPPLRRAASNDVRFEVLRCHDSLNMATRSVHFPHRTGTAQETILMYGLADKEILKRRLRELDSRKAWESIGQALK
jgi:hypothetical protein